VPWHALLLYGGFSQPIQLSVAEIEDHINGNGAEVDDVENHNVADISHHQLAYHTKHVSGQQEELEYYALAFGGSGFPGFPNRDGPGEEKADYHKNFKDLRHRKQPFGRT
jgi:hypothetical protein